MRGAAKWIWIVVFVAFVGAFLLVDMSGMVGQAPVTASTVVAKVNGVEIPYLQWETLTRTLVQQQEQERGRSIDLDERQALEEQAFNQLVSDVLLQQEYERRGIRVTDQEIIEAARYAPPPQFYSLAAFQTDGRFDPEKYQRFLGSATARQQGLLAQLEGYYRAELPRTKLFSQLAADAWVSDAKLWQMYRDERDSARVTFVALRATPLEIEAQQVSDAEARAYYDAHKERFDRPGRGVVSFTSISRVPSAADTAATVERLRALRAEIVAGRVSFEDAARRESADTVSGPDGGDLGRGARGRFVPEFETAAFALRAGEVSQPVRTQFGWHLIKATERKGDTLALRHILLRVAQGDSAATVSDRLADRLAAGAGGASDPAAFDQVTGELGLLVTQIPVQEGQPAYFLAREAAGVSGWAFSGPRVGDISDLFDDEFAYYMVRLDSITRGGVQPFERVKDEIVTLLKERKAVEPLVARGEALLADARGSTLEAAAGRAGQRVQTGGPFTRMGFVDGLGFFNEAVGAAFVAPIGVPTLARTGESVIILRVEARREASREAFEAQKLAQRDRIMQQVREQRVRTFLESLRREADIDDRRDRINSALRRQVVQ
jgi:peptidyl-prolyl cis-trans isomerase D